MTIPITPLSRRPSRWWRLGLLLPGLCLAPGITNVARSSAPISIGEWVVMLGMLLGMLFLAGAVYWNATSGLVTDYDADYLYLFRKSGVELIPLASIYKLEEDKNGGWNIQYYNEQARPEALDIDPITSGLFNARDTSSIYGFIDAVWQHNPRLDIHYNWWLRL